MIVRLDLEGIHNARRTHPGLRWMERLLLLAGLTALGYYGYVFADSWYYQKYENWAFSRNLQGKEASNSDYLQHVLSTKDAGDEPVAPAVDQEHPITKPKSPSIVIPNRQDQSLIGRIEIPRVQVSAIVREGVDSKTLRRAVGHVPGTALPGKPGNIGLAGHRDTFFIGLRGIKKSDRIQLTTLDGEYTYEVDSIKIVTPKDVGVLAPTNEPALTLVTCYPFNYVGSAPKRYIVRAKQVIPAPGDAVEAKSVQPPSFSKPRATRVSERTRPVIRRARVNNS